MYNLKLFHIPRQIILSIVVTRYFHNYEAYKPHEMMQFCVYYYRQLVIKVVINTPTC